MRMLYFVDRIMLALARKGLALEAPTKTGPNPFWTGPGNTQSHVRFVTPHLHTTADTTSMLNVCPKPRTIAATLPRPFASTHVRHIRSG